MFLSGVTINPQHGFAARVTTVGSILVNISVMELPPNVMERGRGCCAGSVLLLKYYLLLHESRMKSE